MKKIICAILAALLALTLALAACAEAVPETEACTEAVPETEAPAEGTLEAILASFELSEEMMALGEEDLSDIYGIEAEDMVQFAAAVNSTGIKADEIVLVEAVDADAAARVQEALDNRYQAKLNELENYLPEEYAVVKACSVAVEGNYVSMIVAPNADDLVKLYSEGIQ